MRFLLLGPLEVLVDGERLPVAAGKQRALLADLLLNANRAVPVARLVDDLWGERAPETAVKSLQVHVSKVRRALPADRLHTRGAGYLLEVGGGELDVADFSRLAARGREALSAGEAEAAADELGSALALWRGPALAEFREPFAELEAPRLEELHLTCLEDRVDADLALGRQSTLVPELESLVSAHPLRERLRAQLMLALYRSGRQAEALEAYQRFRGLLDAELGIEPTSALRQLERRILQQDVSLDGRPARGRRASSHGRDVAIPSRGSKPRPVGRESEIAGLTRNLGEALAGERRVVFVSGEAGAGKTTLVEAVLHECVAREQLLVGRGQCIESRGEGEPYLPVLDAFGRLGRGDDGERVVAQLRRFAPTWLAQLPSLVDDDEREWVARRASGVTPDRMLREMTESLDALAAEVPLALVLEDLHWSDPSTLALVDAIARRPDASRLLLIGTYRSGEEGARPREVARALRLRNLCSEVTVGPFPVEAVAQYLEWRLPGHALPPDMVADVTRRTRGVPLFVEKLVDSWLEAGALERDADSWVATVSLEQLRDDVPESLRELILEQFRPLDPSTRELLVAASVAGSEFASALAAAGAEQREDAAADTLEALARETSFIEPRGEERWPDGTVTQRYSFTHDLCQETLYDGVPSAHRARLHGRIGSRLERAHGSVSTEAAAELAWHFTEAGNAEHAVRHLLAAAERAFGRTAATEAQAHIDGATALLSHLADGDVRRRLELSVLLLESSTRILTEGWVSPNVEGALVRSVALARELGDVAEEAQALVALGAVYEIAGRYSASERVIAEALALPQERLSPELRVGSNEVMACSLMHQGRHEGALDAAETALELAGGDLVPEPVAVFGESPRVSSHVWASLALWHLGRPITAMARAEQAVATAAVAPRAYARSMASVNAAIVSQSLGRPAATRQWAEAGIDASRRAGYPYWQAVASVLRGWARAIEDDGDGLGELREGIEGARATGARLDDAYFLALLADVHLARGELAAGLAAVDEALEEMRGQRSFFCEPELHRLKGELLLADGDRDAGLTSLEHAAEVAARQGALSYELRASVSLARNRRDRVSGERVARLLATFTEGDDLPDLVGARAVLGELGVELPVATRAADPPKPLAEPAPPRAPVLYARSDGLSIAYQVTGRGALDLLLVPGFVSHLEKDWEEPRHAHFLDRLGSFSRLIRFDKRGTGLSDRPEGLPDLETRMDDLRAVMDAAASERAVVFGYSEGGPLSILFAATYPERVQALVLFGAYAKRMRPDEDYPWAAAPEMRSAYIEQVSSEWGFESDMKVMCPSADDAMARWWGERCRAAASPGAVRALLEMNSLIDAREPLSAVHVPTLVLHRTGDIDVRVDEGRYIAQRIPGARFIELEGRDHFVAVDPDQILDGVEPFVRALGGDPVGELVGTDRVLATMMFTDIVGSTQTAARLGDAAWVALLERHHSLVREELARHAGEEVDTAGDGFFATFDGPARAVRCGQAIARRLGAAGLDVRIGVHTGEVQRVQGSFRGIAVHVASRVAAAARAGEVLVSATTRDLVAGSGLAFEDRGDRELKGVEGSRRLFAAVG